jgi:hypothetical protein
MPNRYRRARKTRPPSSVPWMTVHRLALSIVIPMLNRKISAPTTTTKSSGRGISRRGRPCVHPKKKPISATTPVTSRATSWK